MKPPPSFAAFLMVGAVAAGINILARLIIDSVASYGVAILLAFVIALTSAFILNRRFVFRADGGRWRGQFWRFLIVNLISLAQVFAISFALARLIFPSIGMNWHGDTIAHIIGVISPMFTAYLAHKHFTFRARTRPRRGGSAGRPGERLAEAGGVANGRSAASRKDC